MGAAAQAQGPPSPLDMARTELPEIVDTDGGVRVGGFELRAAGGLAAGYDSNVYATPTAATADSLLLGDALLRLDRRAARYSLNTGAFVRARRFAEQDSLDDTEGVLAAELDAGLGTQNRLQAQVDAGRRVESRLDIETPRDLPVSYVDASRARLGLTHQFNRLALAGEAGARRETYRGAGQSFRDLTRTHTELRATYLARGDLAWVLTAFRDRDTFDSPSIYTAAARSDGALVGLRLDVADLVELRFDAGFFERRFDGGGDVSGVALRGALDWQPTRLMRLHAELRRADEPSSLPGALAKIRTEAALEIRHEYSRALSLSLAVRAVSDELRNAPRDERLYLAALGVDRALGRHSLLRLGYDYGTRRHAVAYGAVPRDFSRQALSLSFIGTL